MRRLFFFVLVSGLLALPAAGAQAAAARTPGSVQLSLKYGRGFAKISWRGTLLGRVRRGRIVATRNISVVHWRHRKRVSDKLVAYRGRDMTLRVYSTDGRWRIRINGRGINVSGVVRGWLTLDGVDVGRTGSYSIAGRDPRPWPRAARRLSLGS